jgi:hypothetical protein
MSKLRDMTPREFGRGLMRGDRVSLKLGYTAENATQGVRELHQLSESEAAVLEAYLDGFSAGMRRKPEVGQNVGLRGGCAAAYDEGTADGLREPISRTYPADPDDEPAGDDAEEQVWCEEVGEPVTADRSPGVWMHGQDDLGDSAYDLHEDHAARPPEGTSHPHE